MPVVVVVERNTCECMATMGKTDMKQRTGIVPVKQALIDTRTMRSVRSISTSPSLSCLGPPRARAYGGTASAASAAHDASVCRSLADSFLLYTRSCENSLNHA